MEYKIKKYWYRKVTTKDVLIPDYAKLLVDPGALGSSKHENAEHYLAVMKTSDYKANDFKSNYWGDALEFDKFTFVSLSDVEFPDNNPPLISYEDFKKEYEIDKYYVIRYDTSFPEDFLDKVFIKDSDGKTIICTKVLEEYKNMETPVSISKIVEFKGEYSIKIMNLVLLDVFNKNKDIFGLNLIDTELTYLLDPYGVNKHTSCKLVKWEDSSEFEKMVFENLKKYM